MGFKGVTKNTAPEAEPHIYAEDDAAVYQAIAGADGVFSIGQQFAATVMSNNKVRIGDGVAIIGGHIGRTAYGEYDDMEIVNGQSGYNRNDIIVAKFVTTGTGGIDDMTLEVKQGTAATTATDPALTQDDIYQAGKIRELPLYRVRIEGLSIVAVEQMFEVIPTIPMLFEQLEDARDQLADLNSKLLGFDSEIETLENRYVYYKSPADFGATDSSTLDDMISKMETHSRVQFWINTSAGGYPTVYNEILTGVTYLLAGDVFGVVTIKKSGSCTRVTLEKFNSCKTYVANHSTVNSVGWSAWEEIATGTSNRSISNSYVNFQVASHGKMRVIHTSAYTKTAMSAGKTYTLATLTENFLYDAYQVFPVSTSMFFDIHISSAGVIELIPMHAIPANTAINFNLVAVCS